MQKQKLILIGGGGHCRSCIEVIESQETFEITGILDIKEKIGSSLSGYNVIGTEELVPELVNAGCNFIITLGQIKSAGLRKKLFAMLLTANAPMATVISAKAIVSSRATVGEGSVIMHGAILNAGAVIGKNCTINTNAVIEHDCKIGDNVHISTGAVINGDCSIGDEIFIGSNATVINQTLITDKVIIGAGAVVTRSLESPGIYAGNPCRKIKDII